MSGALPVSRSRQCVRRLATSKALQVQVALAAVGGSAVAVELAVLGADTAVVVDDELLGKPRDRNDALAMLAMLSGRWHQVLSAVALASGNGLQCSLSRSEVRFRTLQARGMRGLLGQRRAVRQGRRLCNPGTRRGVRRGAARQLFGRGGIAAVRDRAAAGHGGSRDLVRAVGHAPLMSSSRG
jgi:hypothetical protein